MYISLTSTDEDVVREFAEIVGAGKVYGPYQYQERRKPFWKWNCDGVKGAGVLGLLRPYLCTRRANRADEVLRAWCARQNRPYFTVSRKGMGGANKHKAVIAAYLETYS